MCELCLRSDSSHSRRSFLRTLALSAAAVATGCVTAPRGRAAVNSLPIRSQAGWARLITPNPFWLLHNEQDAQIATFLSQEANLALDPTGYAVHPANLRELTAFPVIFTNGLTSVTDPAAIENIKEYLQRGGCLYIEGCLDHRVTRNFGTFVLSHVAWLRKLFPQIALRRFDAGHRIHRARFAVAEANLALIEPTADDLRWKDMPQALYGLYDDRQLLAVLSLQHLQCEWFTKADKVPHALRQIANIYTYAMTR